MADRQQETGSPHDVETDLWRVQSSVGRANMEAAQAVKQSATLMDSHRPIIHLSNTQSALVNLYQETVQALDVVEQTIDGIEDDGYDPTPRQIKSEHAERLKEQYDGPVLYLALEILENNRREWLHQKDDTNGAEEVERHGLTRNQREWLNELHEAWRNYDE